MFKRNIFNDLSEWSENESRKPLVLRGARQVGKTTAVQHLSKKFGSYVYLNLEKDEDRVLFDNSPSFSSLVESIFFLKKKRRIPNETLIFIDEIQNSAKAVAMLRYFYEDAPDLHVIAAGSLLESLIDRQISFPVGRVEYMAVRPCSFFEFLGAIGETNFQEVLQQWPFPGYAHLQTMNLFNRFALIGGMPGVVADYAKNSLNSANKVYRSLLAGFTDDVEKYAPRSGAVHHIRHILQTGFKYGAQRVKFERFGASDYRSREIGEAFRILEKALLLELVYPTTSTSLPVLPDYKKSPKLLWLDTGLLNYAAGVQTEVFGATTLNDAWRGLVAEHIVGQELIANSTDVLAQRNFWVREARNSNSEVDYVFRFGQNLVPVEVKSGAGTTLKSLHLFMEQAPHPIAVRIWGQQFSESEITTPSGKKFKLLNIPFYLTGQLETILSKYL